MDGDTRLRITLLDGFQATRGNAVLPVAGTRLRALVIRLALAGGRPVSQGVLADAIWAEKPPAAPAHALQALVSRLRRTLGSAGYVAQATGGYRLDVAASDVDALRFERLAAVGRDRLRAGDRHAAAAVLGEAVALWGDHPGTEPTAVALVAPAVATGLAHTLVEAVVGLADAEVSLGRGDAAAARLTALLADHPVHERAATLLLDALASQGRRAEALAQYEQVRETLAAELGADPGAALRDRHARLLRAEQPAPVAGPSRTAAGHLPAPLTGFVGRHNDLARVDALLAAGRLVTVLGPGGAGKTRLAVEAAHRRNQAYRDGAWMIDLASVTDPAKVGVALLAGTGLRGGAIEARTQGEGDEVDLLVGRLGGRESLLLVDNCEHLIDAVAHLVTALLSRCPGLSVLATSREALAVDGEALVPLGPLTLPGPGDDVEQARKAEAVRLFVERAAAVRPGFEVNEATLPEIRQVVRGLDGMPLALELAAARLRTLSLPELADGLSDRFRLLATGSRTTLPRHRTLGAVIAWSWDLLSEHERMVADRVSVLPGGVTSASATAVCAGTTVSASEVPELLAALVDRSLLQLAPEPGRYRMLETLREYGTERLAGSDHLGTVRDLAAGHFAGLMARYDPQLRGPAQSAAVRVIGAEYDNTLAALRRRCDTNDAPGALSLALDLTWYWHMLGGTSDAAHWLGEALAVPGRGPTPERDCAHAIYLLNRGDTRPVTATGEATDARAEILELADRLLAYPELPGPYGALAALPLAFLQAERTRGQKTTPAIIERMADGDDVWLAGLARIFRAQFTENAGELDRTRADVEAALACFRQVGDCWGQSEALPLRARLRQYDGDLDGALADLREARSLADEFGSLSLADTVFGDLRWIDLHIRRGDSDLVIALIDSARQRVLRARAPAMRLLVDAWEAGFRVRIGELERARELLDIAEGDLPDDIPFPGDHAWTLIGTARASFRLRTGDPTGAQRALTMAYAAALRTRDLPILALVAVHTAALADALELPHQAAVRLGAASRLRGTHDRTDPQVRDLTRSVRAALGADSFAAAYGKGWELDHRTAVTEADPARLSRNQRTH
ncbi:BTAD domain-containing putative transcriptional regulator [Streptomyces nojiriensis]|uniref:BTAD domain-containing putative transcriptional regulator n=1 Tax=Streptomyces nojiriensis TaxID=66374 RepID=UPI0036615EF7